MKRIALIGHRGVGKTSLLTRIERYLTEDGQTVHAIDLDQEIERITNRKISDIFHQDGESKFRTLEQQTFSSLSSAKPEREREREHAREHQTFVLSLGAGFDVAQIPSDWHVIWVRRVTDESGRIFTDRPRLDPHLSALDEYKHRAKIREPKYAARADAVLILDEGIEDANDRAERDYFTEQLDLRGATLTLKPENFERDVSTFLAERLKWNLKWFELRDDLLSKEQLEEATKHIPPENVLLSFRNSSRIEHSKTLIRDKMATDWALELGEPQIEPTFVSKHEGRLEDLKHPRAKLKAAFMTSSFEELMRGHVWQMKDPANRIFLPMSSDGRWAWYRDHRRDYSLNFIRENSGTANDQPTLLQWQRKPDPKTFAAVLGDPVKHSRTPMEHQSFFHPRAVYAIKIEENEFDFAISALKELGLTHAAVTAPLKQKAQSLANANQPINTLAFPKNTNVNMNANVHVNVNASVPHATNTDLIGLQTAAHQLPPTKTQAVWGGGGTLDVIRQVFPNAQLISARTKLTRDTHEPARPPELVIWAATLKYGEQAPPADWKPRYVFDLNYSEASAAREYALKTGATYISGLAMFKAQAQAQREFWETL